MESGKGGCCVARNAGGAFLSSKIDRIMLRFRPIAPKPGAGGPLPAESPIGSKRRCARENRRCLKQRRRSPVVTLPLLPEEPDRKEPPANEGGSSSSSSSSEAAARHLKTWCSGGEIRGLTPPPMVSTPQAARPAWSCVTVEGVTEACLDAGELGRSDEEKRQRVVADACPALVTDAWNGVQWVNEAYRRMVGQEDGAPAVVELAVKEKLPGAPVPAFACRVRVQYTSRRDRSSLTVPCDVWRLAGGGCAWRLDVKAALCLGR